MHIVGSWNSALWSSEGSNWLGSQTFFIPCLAVYSVHADTSPSNQRNDAKKLLKEHFGNQYQISVTHKWASSPRAKLYQYSDWSPKKISPWACSYHGWCGRHVLPDEGSPENADLLSLLRWLDGNPKWILQKCCRLKAGWDNIILEHLTKQWNEWIRNLVHVIKVEWCFKLAHFTGTWFVKCDRVWFVTQLWGGVWAAGLGTASREAGRNSWQLSHRLCFLPILVAAGVWRRGWTGSRVRNWESCTSESWSLWSKWLQVVY